MINVRFMKICPNCQSQYSDNTLNFCLQDGTPLVPPQSAQTVAFGREQETVVANRTAAPVAPTVAQQVPVTSPSGPSYPPMPAAPQPGRSKLLIAAVLFMTFAFLALAAVGVWILLVGKIPFSRTNPMLANTNTNANANANTAAAPKPKTDNANNANAVTPTPANANANANVADPKAKADVEARIDAWRDSLEAVDLDDFMSHYADSVDYYNGRGTTRAAVRDDKSRAFAKFDSMEMTISNLKITVGPGDGRAVAEFDKEWTFTNADGESNSGKVTQQMVLEKIGGKWLITLEKDLRVIRRPS